VTITIARINALAHPPIKRGKKMDKVYLIVCFFIALLLPHLADNSVSMMAQIILQAMFILIGIAGFKTFK